jgi:hypothetical protein
VAQPPTHFCGVIVAPGDPNFAVKAAVSASGVHGGCGGAVVEVGAVVSGAAVDEGGAAVVVGAAVVAVVSPVWRAWTWGSLVPQAAAASASPPTSSPVVIRRRLMSFRFSSSH